jgi:hypothetical protein
MPVLKITTLPICCLLPTAYKNHIIASQHKKDFSLSGDENKMQVSTAINEYLTRQYLLKFVDK